MGPRPGQASTRSRMEANREHKHRLAVSVRISCLLQTHERRVLTMSRSIRFNDIAWTTGNDDRPGGVIAGALENGSLDLWNVDKLLGGDG